VTAAVGWPIFTTGERGEYELRARADGPDAFGGTDDALEPDALLETMGRVRQLRTDAPRAGVGP